MYYEILSYQRLSTIYELDENFNYFQDYAYDCIITTKRYGIICCDSFPSIGPLLPSPLPKRKWLITTIDNCAITQKLKRIIDPIDNYDIYHNPPPNNISQSKEYTLHIKSKAYFDINPYCVINNSKYNIKGLMNHIGVKASRLPELNKMAKRLKWGNKINVVINDKYTAVLEKIGKRARKYDMHNWCFITNSTICQLHKQWDVVLYTDGFTCALNRGEEVDCI